MVAAKQKPKIWDVPINLVDDIVRMTACYKAFGPISLYGSRVLPRDMRNVFT